jgi:hypothetical protein
MIAFPRVGRFVVAFEKGRFMAIMQTVRSGVLGAAVAAAVATAALPALAHHSFTMFDTTKQITLTGTVTSFEWTNPHAYIEIDAMDADRAVKHWSIELGSPSILLKSGWKFNSLKKGDKTTLVINPLKNGQAGGFLNQAILPDGRVAGNGPGRGPQK